MQQDKEKNSASGNRQSDFAGTNPDRYGAPKAENEQDNPINDAESQNVIEGDARISGEEATRARNKSTEGIRQDRDD
jgi:hypothetical protein